MSPNRLGSYTFAEYLQTLVRLNTIDTITSNLDKELADSQKVMDNIKNMFNSIPNTGNEGDISCNNLPHADVLSFLEAGPPQMLPPDMAAKTDDLDLDATIASMKVYAENLKKNIAVLEPRQTRNIEMGDLGLEQYASSLDQLVKRLANIKFNRKEEVKLRNEELEGKLTHLCDDVNKFTQMVKAKTTLSESNKNWTSNQDNNALYYEHIINKLLADINEVTYLLQNKN